MAFSSSELIFPIPENLAKDMDQKKTIPPLELLKSETIDHVKSYLRALKCYFGNSTQLLSTLLNKTESVADVSRQHHCFLEFMAMPRSP